MQKWQYKTIRLDYVARAGYSITLGDNSTVAGPQVWHYINELGRDGWELISVNVVKDGNGMADNDQLLWFKRPLDAATEKTVVEDIAHSDI